MKHVGKPAIISALLQDVKTSCVRTMQGHTYLMKRGLFHWLLLHTYYKIARVVELQLNMEWWKLRVLGSHRTLLPKKVRVLPPLPPPPPTSRTTTTTITQKLMLMLFCLLEKFAYIQEHFSFCANLQTFLTAFHSKL